MQISDIPDQCRNDKSSMMSECVDYSCAFMSDDMLCDLIEDPKYIIFDIRSLEAFEEDHLECALSAPIEEYGNADDTEIALILLQILSWLSSGSADLRMT